MNKDVDVELDLEDEINKSEWWDLVQYKGNKSPSYEEELSQRRTQSA